MKNLVLTLLSVCIIYVNSFAQSTTASNVYSPGSFLGYIQNNALNFRTNNTNRMKLNQNVSYSINGLGGNRNGFMLLSNNPTATSWGVGNSPMGTANFGAFSLLHLIGDDSPFVQEGGYRNWMRNGILLSNNFDAGFIGIRKMPNSTNPGGDDVSDFVINWSDNAGVNPGLRGPDNLVFNFTTGDGTVTDDLGGSGLNGREIMRMNTNGNIGIGPRFSNNFQPQSTLHQHQENSASSWFQISNQHSAGTIQSTAPSSITANDGLRIGIVGSNNTNVNGVAAIYNQENNHLLLSTNAFTNSISPANGATGERVRITSANAPTHLQNGAYGVYNPGGVLTNATRVAITHNPGQPVTRPMSLLHLGYNTGIGAQTGNGQDGWRPWMDIGTFTSNGTDHVYVGLKNEGSTDKHDAVIGWGDNQVNAGVPTTNGPDNMRFIFTSTTAPGGLGTGPAISPDGLEGMRMTPTPLTGIFTGIGGDPSANLYFGGSANPTASLEVNSWGATNAPGGSSGLRFTDLNTTSPPIPNPGTGVLSVNANGDVIYVDLTPPSGGVGNYCPAPQNPLTDDFEVPLDNFNYYFSGQGNMTDQVGVGIPCGTQLEGKIHARQMDESYMAFTSSFPNYPFNGTGGTQLVPISIAGRFENIHPNTDYAFGLFTSSYGFARRIGIYSLASHPGGPTTNSYAGVFDGDVYGTSVSHGVGYFVLSDEKFKKDIELITEPINIIKSLRPTTFYYTDEDMGLRFSNKKQYGFIAQEVERVLPGLVQDVIKPMQLNNEGNVSYGEEEHKTVNYDGFIAILVGAVQEQQVQIDSLNRLVQQQQQEWLNFKQEWEEWKNSNQNTAVRPSSVPSESIELSDMIVLNQNVPNPFAEQTTISYIIPDYIENAQIIFYDMNGKMLKTHIVKTRGEGRLTIYADDLSSGVYSYTLFVDGIVHETKKMIKH